MQPFAAEQASVFVVLSLGRSVPPLIYFVLKRYPRKLHEEIDFKPTVLGFVNMCSFWYCTTIIERVLMTRLYAHLAAVSQPPQACGLHANTGVAHTFTCPA